MVSEIHTEISILRTVKIVSRNLNEIVRSWIRLQDSYFSLLQRHNSSTDVDLLNPHCNFWLERFFNTMSTFGDLSIGEIFFISAYTQPRILAQGVETLNIPYIMDAC